MATRTASSRVPLLVNPGSGPGGRTEPWESLALDHGLEIRPTASAGALEAETRALARGGHERVLVAGGDGTIHHALRGLAGTDCALGIVPRGTGNDLARALGLAAPPAQAIARALGGRRRRIDLGRLDDLPFAGVAGLGIDAEVNRRVRRLRGRFRGPWVYPWAFLRTVVGFRAPHVQIDGDGGTHDGPVLLAAVANAPLFGGGMRIAPAARLDDGWLDLIVIEPVPLARLLLVFPRIYRGTHVSHPAVHASRTRVSTIRADSGLTLHADGEPLCASRPEGVRVEVWPRALWVVV